MHCLASNNHKNYKLQEAFNDFGIENFAFEILLCMKNASKNDRFKKEQYYLDKFKPYNDEIGYNLSDTAYKEVSNMYTVVGDEELLDLILSEEIRVKLKENVNMITSTDDKIIKRYSAKNSLCTNWYINADEEAISQLRRDLENYFRNRIGVSRKNPCYWTANHNYVNQLKSGGYRNSWLPYNSRNVKEKRNNLAFLLNPHVNDFIARKIEYKVDKDLYSLCVLVGWITSVSEIDNEINLYLPSKRMRNIFQEWLYK